MIIKSGNGRVNFNLYIHNERLDIVNTFEFLGIHIDNGLDSIQRKCMTKLNMFYNIRGCIILRVNVGKTKACPFK